MNSSTGESTDREGVCNLLQRFRMSFFTALDNQRNEFEQACIRCVMAFSATIYTFVYIPFESSGIRQYGLTIQWTAATFLVFSLSVLTWIWFSPRPNVLRRIALLCIDIAVSSTLIGLGGRYGWGWYPIYLWIIFGNGMRYGVPYLVLGCGLSVIGFLYISSSSQLWKTYPEVIIGLTLGLILLSYYVAKLLVRLQHEIDKAEHTSDEKTHFLSCMSHEIRTPLNGVIATSDVLSSMNLPAEAKRLVRTVQSSSQAVLGMINDILDIGKIEIGRMPVSCTIFRLREVLLEIRDILGAVARQKNIIFSLYCDVDVPDRLEGDPSHARQILLNIAGNAVKFTHEGSVALRVYTSSTADDRVTLEFQVIDSGIGIQKAQKERVFQPFVQVERAPGSTGLGMTIARELADLMGGKIRYESEVGVGTTFYIALPFVVHDDGLDSIDLEQPEILWVGASDMDREPIYAVLNQMGVKTSGVRDLPEGRSIDDMTQHTETDVVVFVDWRVNQAGRLIQDMIRSTDRLRHIGCIAWVKSSQQKDYLIRSGATAVLTEGCFDAIHIRRAVTACIRQGQSKVTGAARGVLPEHPIRVLVADGQRINRDVLGMALSELQAEVSLVEDGEALLLALEEEMFDAVIVEMSLPDMTGLDAIQSYRLANPRSSIPFILITADATVETLNSLRTQGITNILTKPYRVSQLVDLVRDLVVATRIDGAVQADMTDLDQQPVNTDTVHKLVNLASSDPIFPVTVYRNYTATAQKVLTRMQILLNAGRFGELRGHIVMLRDTAQEVGAQAVYRQCDRMIHLNEDDFSESALLLLGQLEHIYEQSCLPLQEALQLLPGNTSDIAVSQAPPGELPGVKNERHTGEAV